MREGQGSDAIDSLKIGKLLHRAWACPTGTFMSFQAMAWAVSQKLPCASKMVLVMLSDRHNGDSGRCDPSHDKLADDCGLSRRSVIDHLAKLEVLGLITVTNRVREGLKTSNQYRLNLSTSINAPDVQQLHIDVQQAPDQCAGAAHRVVQELHIKQEVEPVIEPGNQYRPMADLKDVAPQIAADWLALRKKKKAPVTATVINSFRKNAAAAGMTLDDVLALCCANGWQGFDPSWVQRTSRQASGETAYAKAMREKYEIVAPTVAARNPAASRNPTLIFDTQPKLELTHD